MKARVALFFLAAFAAPAFAAVTVTTSAETVVHLTIPGGSADQTYPVQSVFILVEASPAGHPGQALVEDPATHLRGYISNAILDSTITKPSESAAAQTSPQALQANIQAAKAAADQNNSATHFIDILKDEIQKKLTNADDSASTHTRADLLKTTSPDAFQTLTGFGLDSILDAYAANKADVELTSVTLIPALAMAAKTDDIKRLATLATTDTQLAPVLADPKFIGNPLAAQALTTALANPSTAANLNTAALDRILFAGFKSADIPFKRAAVATLGNLGEDKTPIL